MSEFESDFVGYVLEAVSLGKLLRIGVFDTVEDARQKAEQEMRTHRMGARKVLEAQLEEQPSEEWYAEFERHWEEISSVEGDIILFSPRRINRGATMLMIRPISASEYRIGQSDADIIRALKTLL
ncbi:MAG TPA: hypothetical protein PKD55_00305 [Bellilinea sp.]|nr:hypothetical protein [Bellilinea sp.]